MLFAFACCVEINEVTSIPSWLLVSETAIVTLYFPPTNLCKMSREPKTMGEAREMAERGRQEQMSTYERFLRGEVGLLCHLGWPCCDQD